MPDFERAKDLAQLTAIINVYSRIVVGWQVSNTSNKANQTSVMCIKLFANMECRRLLIWSKAPNIPVSIG